MALDTHKYRYIGIGILSFMAVIVLLTFRHYGVTWDEELQSQYGQAVVDYYASGFKDLRFQEIFNLYLYGGTFDGLASVVDSFTPFSVYETRHLINAMCGLLGLWGTWKLARTIGGEIVGLLALILLATTPMYYGHMFNNPKDIPFATGIVWSIYFMARVFKSLPNPCWRLLLKLGLVYGLTLGVRVGGVMLFAFWVLPLAFYALNSFLKSSEKRTMLSFLRQAAFILIRIILPVAILSYVMMLVCWPWAQQSPVQNPLRALSEFSNFPQDVEVLLDGTTYRSTQLPWYYVPLYFAVQLPELLLVLVFTTFYTLPFIVRTELDRAQKQTLVVMALMILFPILYAVFHHPALYDTVRHFLFVVPLVCVLAALSGHYIYRQVAEQTIETTYGKFLRRGVVALCSFAVLSQVVVMVQLHPYEYIFANQFAGGVGGIWGRYELDYWGSSFKEAAEELQTYVSKHGGVPDGKIYRIAICGPWDSAMIYLPPDYEPVVASEPADFFLSTTRWMCQDMRPGKDIIIISRKGVPLSVVKDLR